MSPEEQEKENAKDERICRMLQSRACWVSAYERAARRSVGKPVPPPELDTGLYRRDTPNPSNISPLAKGLIIVGGGIVIVGGIILAPEITVPTLIVGGAASQ